MIPSAHQFRRWTLPTRWTFAASIGSLIGVVLAVVALWVAIAGPSLERERERTTERHALAFQAAQELRSNSELLAQIGSLEADETLSLGTDPYSADALQALISGHFSELTKDAYGEEKYIYQEVLRLGRWLNAMSSLSTSEAVSHWNRTQEFTVHDALFLNDFLWWYLHSTIEDDLSDAQKRGLGWGSYPQDVFQVPSASSQLKQFVVDGRPISGFSDYLGLLD